MKTHDKHITNWEQLAAYLSGNLTQTEKQEIEAWINASAENQKEFQKIEKLWNASNAASAINLDIDKAWNKVNAKAAINPVKERKLWNSNYLIRIAAVLIVGLISWALYSYFSNPLIDFRTNDQVASLTLEDGSKITLNGNSSVKYPKHFKGDTREINLEGGEAFFEVAKNPQKPFIIHTSTTDVKVLGTSFNVKTSKEGNVEVIVNTGIVAVTPALNQDSKVVLKHDERAYYNASNGQINKENNADINFMSWKTKCFTFREALLSDVFTKIEQVYQIKINNQMPANKVLRLNASYQDLEIEKLMAMIAKTFDLNIQKTDNKTFTVNEK